jgi:iron(III) transport system substrate-binding protein
MLLLILAQWTSAPAHGAAADPALLKAKKAAESSGFLFVAQRDEIIAGAKQEGQLRALLGLEVVTQKALQEGFRRQYPFIRTHFEEITGTDASQRFMLELKSERPLQWDIAHMSAEHHSDYLPYLLKVELHSMAQQGVLNIHPKMISAQQRNTIAVSTMVDVLAYNKKLVPEDKLPKTWDDMLKPEYKGRKFLTDIKPNSVAALVPAMGMAWVENFARRLSEQQPLWVRGHTRSLSGMANGEHALLLGAYWHTVMRMKKRGLPDLDFAFLEPVPLRVTETYGILNSTKNRHAALLFFEYMAGAEGQKILWDIEPYKSSIYAPGSRIEELVRGKKTSLLDWEHVVKQDQYMDKIFAAYGFPKIDRR